ncbi:MAG: HAMP domain-containing protein [Planctomycetes bacterium]|nr:HAMP domain-containing protein [Planctomycetota bacterium]
MPSTSWMVVVAEPLALTTAPAVSEIRRQTAYFAGVASLLALVLGALIARQISRPVLALREGALAVAEGPLGRDIRAPADGELLELMQAFNFMSARLERNRQEIDAKNQEIETWNQELQARVDARTRELEEAQERLVRSARLAAAGEMGAGLAHELNNPLAGILGLTQVLLAKAEGGSRAMLKSMEEQALRCKEIVRTCCASPRRSRARIDPRGT